MFFKHRYGEAYLNEYSGSMSAWLSLRIVKTNEKFRHIVGVQENLPMPVGHHHPPGQRTAVVSLRSKEISDLLLPLGCVSSLKYSRLADRRA